MFPCVDLSAAIPGMKWSAVLEMASMGIRTTGDHVVPSAEVLITMSFELQPLRNRQSCHTR